jgi:hypothetical protein
MSENNDLGSAAAAAPIAPVQPDIVEMGRRWQKAWTSHRPGSNNAVGDSFGQLTDEIERLRTMSAAMAVDEGLWFAPQTAAEAYLQQELRKLCAAIEGVSPDDCARASLKSAFEKAMAPRENPRHPMFRHHNCAVCASGEKPCKGGNPSLCGYPLARND